MTSSKDQHAFIEKQPSPSSTIMKASGIFPVPGEANMGQHIISINKPGPHKSLGIQLWLPTFDIIFKQSTGDSCFGEIYLR